MHIHILHCVYIYAKITASIMNGRCKQWWSTISIMYGSLYVHGFHCAYISCLYISCSYISYSYISCSYISCSYISCSYISCSYIPVSCSYISSSYTSCSYICCSYISWTAFKCISLLKLESKHSSCVLLTAQFGDCTCTSLLVHVHRCLYMHFIACTSK